MDMVKVVFSGQLLDGYVLDSVRAAVAERLQLGAAQVDRLFSGRTVVLKKAISVDGSAAYLAELRRLGMDARVEPMAPSQLEERPLATFKVVFWGKLLRGYDQSLVMRAVTRRLQVTPQQLVQMFAGGKVVLKRRVNAETGARYVTELARIGMLVELEVETEALQPAPSFVLQPVTLETTAEAPAAPTADEGDAFAGLLKTQLDMSQAMRVVQAEEEGDPETVAEEGVVPGFRPNAMPAVSADHATIMVPQTPSDIAPGPATVVRNSLQIKCPQCGRHQLAGPRCRTCGIELEGPGAAPKSRPTAKVKRMDASAYGAVTTLMQGLRNAVAPSKSEAAGVPTWMFRLRDDMADRQDAPTSMPRVYLVIGVVLAILALAWWMMR